MKTREFFRKEGQTALVCGLILLAIQLLPSLLAINQQGAIYEKYYKHALPIPFTWLLVGLIVIRFLIVTAGFFLNREEGEGH